VMKFFLFLMSSTEKNLVLMKRLGGGVCGAGVCFVCRAGTNSRIVVAKSCQCGSAPASVTSSSSRTAVQH
jgi:hypothetical protein